MWSTIIIIIVFYKEYVQCANILGVFPFPSYSHQILYQPIWKELSLKGHNVTVITPNPLNDSSLTNLTEISAKNLYKLWEQKSIQDILSKESSSFFNLVSSYRFGEELIEAEFSSRHFQELIRDRSEKYDLILLETFLPILNSIGEIFQAPVISICPVGGITFVYNNFGNPNHPVLYPDSFLSFSTQLSLWEKIVSTVFTVWALYCHYYSATPRSQELAKKLFGENFPHVEKIERNISMIFLNVNRSIYPRRPNSPALVEMDQIHLKPVEPLPNDLQEILDEAKEGVIYFSLGTNIKSEQLEEKLRKIIVEAFSELPYKVIWKYESNNLPNKPANVIIRKWFPQKDILAHPNIRAFVTQGGLQSIGEGISNGVPLIGLPFIGDQPMNVRTIVELGLGIGLDPVSVTKQKLKDCIIEVSENKAYKKRVKQVSKQLTDKQIKTVEEVVWWSQYVIRHKGAKHLRSPSADISWFHYLMIDIFIIFIVAVTIVIVVFKRLYRLLIFKLKNFWS